MSTYWDVVCLDCDVSSGLHINHGDRVCAELATSGAEIGGLYPLYHRFCTAPFYAEFDLRVLGEQGNVNIEWFSVHAKHALAARDEYGDVYGDCGEWDNDETCRLPKDHEGVHKFYPRHEPGPVILARRKAQGR